MLPWKRPNNGREPRRPLLGADPSHVRFDRFGGPAVFGAYCNDHRDVFYGVQVRYRDRVLVLEINIVQCSMDAVLSSVANRHGHGHRCRNRGVARVVCCSIGDRRPLQRSPGGVHSFQIAVPAFVGGEPLGKSIPHGGHDTVHLHLPERSRLARERFGKIFMGFRMAWYCTAFLDWASLPS